MEKVQKRVFLPLTVPRSCSKLEYVLGGFSMIKPVSTLFFILTVCLSNLIQADTIVENEEYKTLPYERGVESGGVLDFSSLSSRYGAPAGRYGNVIVKRGHYEFENKPGESIRFFGINIAMGSALINMSDAEQSLLVDTLATSGYNSVRLHRFDRFIIASNQIAPDVFNSQALERIDHAIFLFKQKGIYITTDLLNFWIPPSGSLPEFSRDLSRAEFQVLVKFFPSAQDLWKRYATAFFNHVNPYTRLAYKDEPALFHINLLNEENIYNIFNTSKDVAALLDKGFKSWLAEKKVSPSSTTEENRQFLAFLADLDVRGCEALTAHLRSLGVRTPVGGANHERPALPLVKLRSTFDVVDSHIYFDHPKYRDNVPGKRPYSFKNQSAVSLWAETPRKIMASRVLGKPFLCTEFNYCSPNEYRSEGGLLMGAYAAFQNWDGIFRFAFIHQAENFFLEKDPSEKKEAKLTFNTATDPVMNLSEKMAALLFLRNDVSPTKNFIPFAADDSLYTELLVPEKAKVAAWNFPSDAFPDSFSKLGLCTGVGSVFLRDDSGQTVSFRPFAVGFGPRPPAKLGKLPYYRAGEELGETLVKDGLLDGNLFQKDRVQSDTREMLLNQAQGTFAVQTEKSEGFILPAGAAVRGRVATVSCERRFCTVFVSSIDDKSLQESERILVLHLTDVKASGQGFGNSGFTSEESQGFFPLLVARGSAKIDLALGKKVRAVYHCDTRGKRLGETEFLKTPEGISFVAETVKGGKANAMVYEILAQ